MSFFLFPGQGSQKAGMGKDFHDQSPAARAVFDEATEVLGENLLDVMFNGPAELLTDTRNAQVALVTCGVAIARHLAAAGLPPSGTAGHSIGEIGALVAAESLDFADALRLTHERARLMAEDAPPGTMAAVLGLDPDTIAQHLPDGAEIANFNAPAQTIISGPKESIEAAVAALKAAGAKRVLPLPVSGAFHSSLMRRPAEGLQDYLKTVALRAPNCRFVSSVSGCEETDPSRIKILLGQQLYSPVRWTETMTTIGPVQAVEAGPGNVLQGLAKRTDGAPIVSSAGTLEAASALVAV